MEKTSRRDSNLAAAVNTADLLTVGLLVLLEGLLSADNALVLGILVLGLPRPLQKKALRYDCLGRLPFEQSPRFAAILLGRRVEIVGHWQARSRRESMSSTGWQLGMTVEAISDPDLSYTPARQSVAQGNWRQRPGRRRFARRQQPAYSVGTAVTRMSFRCLVGRARDRRI